MESKILHTLGDILFRNSCSLFEVSYIKDELVGATVLLTFIENLEASLLESGSYVVCI
jgi:hypothetical protein